MTKQTVYVLTHLEMGWDCVCGAYKSYEGALRHIYNDHQEKTFEELVDMWDDDDGESMYVITERKLEE